jgi:hypothetical protein
MYTTSKYYEQQQPKPNMYDFLSVVLPCSPMYLRTSQLAPLGVSLGFDPFAHHFLYSFRFIIS